MTLTERDLGTLADALRPRLPRITELPVRCLWQHHIVRRWHSGQIVSVVEGIYTIERGGLTIKLTADSILSGQYVLKLL